MTIELADYQPGLDGKRLRKTAPCFRCGRHLYGNHNKKLRNTEDGIERTFHKSCAFDEMTENPSNWEER